MQKIKLKETIEQIIKLLDKKNMKAKALKNCSTGLRNIIRFFDKRGLNDIVLEQLDEFLLEMHKEHISGKFGIEKWRNIRRGCEMVKLFVAEGSIDIGVLGRWDYSRGIPMQYIESDPIAYLHGKGGKTRTVPLLPKTVQHCKRYLKKFHSKETLDSEEYVFYTVSHEKQHKMSHDNVADFMEKYCVMAASKCPDMPEHLHPHMLRHTRAMHLYRAGMPLELLSQFMGHASTESTKIYAYADTEMKRTALEKIENKSIHQQTVAGIWEDDEDMILRLSGLA